MLPFKKKPSFVKHSKEDTTDILIIFPNNRIRAFGSLSTEIAAITPPIQDGLLASYLRSKGFVANLIDADALSLTPAEVAAKVHRLSPALVMVSTDQVNTGDVTKMQAAEDTLAAIKDISPLTPIIIYGNVPSAFPEKVLSNRNVDFVCQGEPFVSTELLLSSIKSANKALNTETSPIPGIWSKNDGKTVPGKHSSKFPEIDNLPYTAWDLINPRHYRAHHWHCFGHLNKRSPYAAILTNMGCPYNCSFCCVNVTAGGPNLRQHSIEYVIGEIDILVKKYSVQNIRILDNIFTIQPDYTVELCERISRKWKNLNLWAYARVETVKSPQMLRAMKKAGINWLAYGFESANSRVRRASKKLADDGSTSRVIEWTRSAGINIVANFIFGLPQDNLRSMESNLKMAKDFRFEWVNFYCAMAYPGTQLHEECLVKRLPMPTSWSGYSQYSPDSQPLPTKFLSSSEVLRFRDEAFKDYYHDRSYQNMIAKKFGDDAKALIARILRHKIKRNAGTKSA